jgi:peptide/nickel transport system permease protein
MLKYLFRRILIFIPTLFVISLIAFWLSKMAPGDATDNYEGEGTGLESTEKSREDIARRLGLDKPVFYINFTSSAYPDTLFEIKSRYQRENLKKLIAQYGNWTEIENYYQKIRSLQIQVEKIPDTLARDRVINIQRALNMLFVRFKDNQIIAQIEKIKGNTFRIDDDSKDKLKERIESQVLDLENAYSVLKEKATPSLLYIPTIHWYGLDNQYHNWITAFLTGDFGVSYRDGQPVLQRLKTPMFWTLVMNLMAITIAFLISIPIGVYSAVKKDTAFDKITTVALFILYSLPTFWIGTLLVVFFTNPEYGMDWFCGIGLGNSASDAPFWTRFWETACHFVLPVFCLTYGSFAFISRQMRGSMLNTIQQDYIRTAKAKGLSSNTIIWKHAFRNALFPLITMIAVVFPATISGSVVIEVIFNIPGMGREVYNAIFAKDWAIVYTILMLVAVLTMIGNLVADMLYAIADPRISYRKY